MKINRVSIERRAFAFLEPYEIAYETYDGCENILLRLETDTGLVGWGCAAPDPAVTGETIGDVVEAYHRVIEPRLHGETPLVFARILEDLKPATGPAARAMADTALLDLLARKADMPLYQMLGGFRECIATSITLGICDLRTTLERSAEYVQQGFRALKIKGGNDVEEDIERLEALRTAVGPDIELRFDANQGYTLDQALNFIRRTEHIDLELLEQPTSIEDEDLLARVIDRSTIPVMADESVLALKDVFRLVRHGRADLVNIKLMKAGGIDEGLRINSTARAAGVEAMVGCMDECGLGIAAGLHLALARPNIAYADLDGHLGLIDDPWASLVDLREGVLYPRPGAGLGDLPEA